MKIYEKTIIRHLFSPFLMVLAVITSVVWLVYTMRLLYLIDRGIGFFNFLYLSILTIPSLMTIIIPVATICTCLYSLHKMNREQEITILENIGLNYYQIGKPFLKFAAIITLFGYLISLYLLPLSYSILRDKLQFMRDNFASALVREKVFSQVTKKITIYVDKKLSKDLFEGVIIFDFRENNDPAVLFAEHGKMEIQEQGPYFELVNGNRQSVDTSGNLQNLHFDSFKVHIANPPSTSKRNIDLKEKYLFDLLFPDPNESKKYIYKHLAEGNQRLIWPLFNLIIVALVASINLASERTRTFSYTRPLASILIVLFLIIANIILSTLSVVKPAFNIILYFNLLLGVGISMFYFRKKLL